VGKGKSQWCSIAAAAAAAAASLGVCSTVKLYYWWSLCRYLLLGHVLSLCILFLSPWGGTMHQMNLRASTLEASPHSSASTTICLPF